MKVFKCSSYQISIASMFIAHCIAIHSHLDTANKAIKILINFSKNGIYHVSGKQKLSRYEFGFLVKKHFKNSSSELIEVKSNNNDLNLLKDLSLINSKEFEKFESIEKYISKALKHD